MRNIVIIRTLSLTLVLITVGFILLLRFGIPSVSRNKLYSIYMNPGFMMEEVFTAPLPGSEVHRFGIPGRPVVADSLIYFPVMTGYNEGSRYVSTSAIYAYDYHQGLVTDSLFVSHTGTSGGANHIVVDNNNFYLVGVKDNACVIYKTDKHLKQTQEFTTKVRLSYVMQIVKQDNLLRVVSADSNSAVSITDIDLASMKAVSTHQLLAKYDQQCQDKNFLWFFINQNKQIKAIRYDLSKSDLQPSETILKVNINRGGLNRSLYKCMVIDNTVYISYSFPKRFGGYKYRMISANLKDNKVHSRYVDALGLGLLSMNNKTYTYKSGILRGTGILTLSELTPDLKEQNPLKGIFLDDLTLLSDMVQLNGNKFILTGSRGIKTGKKITVEKYSIDETIPHPFMAIMELK